MQNHTSHFRAAHPLPETSLHAINISNRVQCFTDIEPHVDREMSLSTLVVSGAELNETLAAAKTLTGATIQ
jgi:hypothetical protein